MADFSQQILEIEKEIRETPYHKGTEEHIGKLRARLARLNDKLVEGELKKGGGGGGGGYAVKKQGDATVVLVGPPSVGKSTLINALTNAESKVAPYSFTTVSVIPGMMKYKDAYIQILDVPGLIKGAKEGKGRGREVLSVARGADLLLIMTDVEKLNRFEGIVSELAQAGIRVNEKPPDVTYEKKAGGGIIVRSNISQVFSKDMVKEVAKEFGIKNAEISLKEKLTFDRLLDAFSANRAYIQALFVVNKSDLGKRPSGDYSDKFDPIFISSANESGLEELKEKIWEKLELVRVFLIKPGDSPNTNEAIILKKGQTLSDVAQKVGQDFFSSKRFAKIWGPSSRFPGQEVSLVTPITEGIQVRFE